MSALRNIKGTRLNKKNNSLTPRFWYVLIACIVLVIAAALTVSKIRTGKISSDLTPGKIYLKEFHQRHKEPVKSEGSENKPADGDVNKDGKDDPGSSDSFTFYKSLNGKEGRIIPLSVNVPKTDKNKKEDAEAKPPQPEKILQPEKMLQIEEKIDKIDKNIEKIVKKENYYTVQIAAYSSEETANDIITKLKKIGHSPYLVRESDVNGKKLIKVRVGRFSSAVDAQSVAKALKQGGYDTYVIKN
ncbi:MAG: SPOR domain-containing protein [Nitrospira sp.]|nr:SPOR domain-containing protein [Nitrospira sp.]